MYSNGLSTLQFHILKNQNQFDRANIDGRTNENELYLTPAQDIDNIPEDGSENLITSGGVYDAIQNINILGAFSKQGRYIEINENSIDSTLGKSYQETHTDIIFDTTINSMSLLMENGFYIKDLDFTYSNLLIDDTVFLRFKLKNQTNYTELSSNILYQYDQLFLLYNIEIQDTDPALKKIDNTIPGFCIAFYLQEKRCRFFSLENYTGMEIYISKTYETTNYIRLPEHALEEGSYIEIKDGIISSTLGRKIGTKIIQEEKFNLDFSKISCEEEEFPSEKTTIYYQFSLNDIPNLTIGNKINIKLKTADEAITFSDLLIEKSTISNTDGIIIFANAESCDWEEEFEKTGITKINENLPAFVFIAIQRTDTLEKYGYIFTDEPFNYTPYFSFLTEKEQDEYITLPNSALSFDKEPTKNSTNLITSGTLYDLLGDVSSALKDLGDLIG